MRPAATAERPGASWFRSRPSQQLCIRTPSAAPSQLLPRPAAAPWPHTRAAVSGNVLQPMSAAGWDAFDDEDSDVEDLLSSLQGARPLASPPTAGWLQQDQNRQQQRPPHWPVGRAQRPTLGTELQDLLAAPAAPQGVMKQQVNMPYRSQSNVSTAAEAAAAAATAAAHVLRDMHAAKVALLSSAPGQSQPSHLQPTRQPSQLITPAREIAVRPAQTPIFRNNDAAHKVSCFVEERPHVPVVNFSQAASLTSANVAHFLNMC